MDSEGDGVGMLSPERERVRKKRKQSTTAVDKIDTLFDDAIGRKVVWSALESVPVPGPDFVKSVLRIADSMLKQGWGQGDQSVNRHTDLGAVVDAIQVAPLREGKKRSKQRQNSAWGQLWVTLDELLKVICNVRVVSMGNLIVWLRCWWWSEVGQACV